MKKSVSYIVSNINPYNHIIDKGLLILVGILLFTVLSLSILHFHNHIEHKIKKEKLERKAKGFMKLYYISGVTTLSFVYIMYILMIINIHSYLKS
jgi:tellurite resistance protein TehA-like permease